MPKGTGQRGHRTKADSALSRKATPHHDFVGQAEADREKSREVEEERIRRDREALEKETVGEMARELEQVSGVSEPAQAPRPPPPEGAAAAQPQFPLFEIPKSLREGLTLLRERGPQALDALRAKAEQRLGEMPSPVRTAVHLTERAVGLALWPVRVGARIVGRALETPAALIRILVARRT